MEATTQPSRFIMVPVPREFVLPHSAAVLDSRGFVHLRRKEFDKAISDYDAALKIDPKAAWPL